VPEAPTSGSEAPTSTPEASAGAAAEASTSGSEASTSGSEASTSTPEATTSEELGHESVFSQSTAPTQNLAGLSPPSLGSTRSEGAARQKREAAAPAAPRRRSWSGGSAREG